MYILPKPISKFVERYPSIRLKLSNVTGRSGRELVLSDEVDFSVSSMLDVPDNLDYSPFVSYSTVLITPLGHPLTKLKKVTLQDIAEHPLILPPSNYSSWRLLKMVFGLSGVRFNVAVEAGGWEVIKSYVQIGMGVSIVTRLCITEEDKDKMSVIPLDEHFPNRKYGIVIRKGKHLSSPAQRFINILREHYKLQ